MLRRKIALGGMDDGDSSLAGVPILSPGNELSLELLLRPLGVGGVLVLLLDLLCPTTIPLASELPLLLLRSGEGFELFPMLPWRLLSVVLASVVQLPLLTIAFGLASSAVVVLPGIGMGVGGVGEAGVAGAGEGSVAFVVGAVGGVDVGVVVGTGVVAGVVVVGCAASALSFFLSTNTSVEELDRITSRRPCELVVIVVVVLETIVVFSGVL